MSSVQNNINGWLIIDKPTGTTSSRVVGKVKYLTKVKKVGHAGTLDPMATGILPIALGEATKTVQYYMGKEKEYIFDISFGSETNTLDKEGTITRENGRIPDKKEIISVLEEFIGETEQVPPAFSAVKINGKRAYKLARKGQVIKLESRIVKINELSLIEQISNNVFRLRTRCGKGTYIRSLARDIAYKLGTYGHLTMLRRSKLGQFEEKNAISLEKLAELVYVGALFEELLSIDTALDDIPVVKVDTAKVRKIKNGQTVFIDRPESNHHSGKACAKYNNQLVAIGTVKEGSFKPERVFNY